MASFDPAVSVVLDAEGGYKNEPNDHADPTNFGITQEQYPDIDIKNLTSEKAIEIYYKDYWLQDFELIQSQDIVNKVFSIGVNVGMSHAIINLQRAVRAASGNYLKEDGVIGSKTINAVNQCNSEILLAALKSECAAYYRLCNNPAELKGWLNRAYS